MGTHNRLLKIATEVHRTAYLEIIAINREAANPIPTGARRWFDMDDLALQARAAQHGPTLVHWVAGVPHIAASVNTLTTMDIDRGPVVQATRPTPHGLLQWQISVRPDGQRLFEGCLPTLIQWGETHPTHTMPDSGIRLTHLSVQHPQAKQLNAAYRAIGLADLVAAEGPARLCAHLQTPLGPIELST